MNFTPPPELTAEKRLLLNAEKHSAVLVQLYLVRKGHFYVHGSTGTGKSVVARQLAALLDADLFSYECLTEDAFETGYDAMTARLRESDKKVIIIDGFFPRRVSRTFRTLTEALSRKGTRLFIFSQEPPAGCVSPSQQNPGWPDDAFVTTVTFRYNATGSRYPVQYDVTQ